MNDAPTPHPRLTVVLAIFNFTVGLGLPVAVCLLDLHPVARVIFGVGALAPLYVGVMRLRSLRLDR